MTIQLMRLIIIVLISAGLLTLEACASGIKDPVLGSPTVANSYESAMQGTLYTLVNHSNHQHYNHSVSNSNMPLSVLPKLIHKQHMTINNTLNAQFPTLPNPKSVMYVFGHYADDGEIPVAGHFLPFSLYTRTYYALPNEVLTPYNDGQFTEIQKGNT